MESNASSRDHVILCVNCGSSSLKFALYCLGDVEETLIVHGAVERIGLPGGRLWIKGKDNDQLADIYRDFADFNASTEGIAAAARDLGFPTPAAAGHRVVHGGPNHFTSERVDATLLAELRRLIP